MLTVILDILRKWGGSEFHPDPKEIIHFTVMYPLIEELRQWTGIITLLKVKSHTGCLLNERADEQAELGRAAEALRGLKSALVPKSMGLFGCGCGQRQEGSQPSTAKSCLVTVRLTGVF